MNDARLHSLSAVGVHVSFVCFLRLQKSARLKQCLGSRSSIEMKVIYVLSYSKFTVTLFNKIGNGKEVEQCLSSFIISILISMSTVRTQIHAFH